MTWLWQPIPAAKPLLETPGVPQFSDSALPPARARDAIARAYLRASTGHFGPARVLPTPAAPAIAATLSVYPDRVYARPTHWWRDPSFFAPASAPASAPVIPGVGPAGAATFVLTLEDGSKVTYEWATDIMPAWDGTEQRATQRAAPRQLYDVPAYLQDADDRTTRAALVSGAASGSPFLLGLAYEEMTLSADAAGATVFVSSTSSCDWTNPGQRVVCIGPDGSTSSGVVQSSASGSITLDTAPGAAGKRGGRIMPAQAIYLDPQQGFSRYQVRVEHWQIKAHAVLFGFAGVDTMGVGASLTTFDGLYVFDRGLAIDEQSADSMQSLAEIIDMGGVLASAGSAAVPVWGREVKMLSNATADWQWFKAFMSAVRGPWNVFLLPSYRPDFVFVSKTSASSIKIQSSSVSGAGDITKWFPASPAHQRLRIVQTDGSVVYGKISTVGDNGDGTTTVVFTAAIVTGTPLLIGWLELARFESDSIDVVWSDCTFSVSTTARVVPQ